MLFRFRPRLNHASAVAYLALFVALGGTAIAAHHYLLTSTKQISPKVLKKLRGRRGLRGPAGPVTTTLPSGQTLRGEFKTDQPETSNGDNLGSAISFGGFRLKTAPTPSEVDVGGPPTTSCPGTTTNPAAARGKLCLYLTYRSPDVSTTAFTLGPVTTEDATGTDRKTDPFGAQLYARSTASGRAEADGTWAVTSP